MSFCVLNDYRLIDYCLGAGVGTYKCASEGKLVQQHDYETPATHQHQHGGGGAGGGGGLQTLVYVAHTPPAIHDSTACALTAPGACRQQHRAPAVRTPAVPPPHCTQLDDDPR